MSTQGEKINGPLTLTVEWAHLAEGEAIVLVANFIPNLTYAYFHCQNTLLYATTVNNFNTDLLAYYRAYKMSCAAAKTEFPTATCGKCRMQLKAHS